ncbi:aspartic peptidase domain-containing protein [Blyttiomyces helicus]|uniref:Aspartic peptidase domain-containing protein n=1 Tax=Blyttiomyces helicus TaxID=388810 RepID=A0A4P9WCR5_9FUNG|nr:aspartic peptidase domain-containing protein [Blyttiomyces helicus]|eukprot:RKO88700.1 aspartic peptidase domain-containing protein [Blyttiomyces helicus]
MLKEEKARCNRKEIVAFEQETREPPSGQGKNSRTQERNSVVNPSHRETVLLVLFRGRGMMTDKNLTASSNPPTAEYPVAKTPLAELPDSTALYTFVGMVDIGTPSQTFNVIFDTGSTKAWVRPGASVGFFDTNKSTTFTESGVVATEIDYGDGTVVQGTWATDRITIAGFSSPAQPFVQATVTTKNGNATHAADGIVGMARAVPPGTPPPMPMGTPAEIPYLTSWWQEIVAYRLVACPVFAFDFDTQARTGQLTIGGVDQAMVGGVAWIPLNTSNSAPLQWTVQVTGMQVANTSIPLSIAAGIDTGTSLILLPTDLSVQINTALRGTLNSSDRFPFWTVPYTGLPPVMIAFGATMVTLYPDQYTFRIQGGCRSGFSNSDKKFAVLGSMFLR